MLDADHQIVLSLDQCSLLLLLLLHLLQHQSIPLAIGTTVIVLVLDLCILNHIAQLLLLFPHHRLLSLCRYLLDTLERRQRGRKVFRDLQLQRFPGRALAFDEAVSFGQCIQRDGRMLTPDDDSDGQDASFLTSSVVRLAIARVASVKLVLHKKSRIVSSRTPSFLIILPIQ